MLEVSHGMDGRLEAQFEAAAGTTGARVVAASAPLELRGPFAEGDVSRFYLRNVSCGVFAGDAYRVRLRARAGARAFVSGTAATKVHAMPGGCATSAVRIESSPDAVLAYYDGPTILQQASDLVHRVEIVAGGGIAVYAEVLVLGRLARGETLDFRAYRSELVVRDEAERPLYVERYELRPHADRSSIADASLPVLGKVIVAGATDETEAAVRSTLRESSDDVYAGFDWLPSPAGIVMRAAGPRMEPVARIIDAATSAVCHQSTN